MLPVTGMALLIFGSCKIETQSSTWLQGYCRSDMYFCTAWSLSSMVEVDGKLRGGAGIGTWNNVNNKWWINVYSNSGECSKLCKGALSKFLLRPDQGCVYSE